MLHLPTRLPPPALCFDAARDLRLHERVFAHTGEVMVEGPAHRLRELGDVIPWEALKKADC